MVAKKKNEKLAFSIEGATHRLFFSETKQQMDPTKKELYTAKRTSGVNIEYDPHVQETIQLLTRNTTMENSVNWLLLKVVNTSDLALHASGTGGVKELLENINNDDIYYGFFKCFRKDNDSIKYFNVYFIGESVTAMKKGKSALYKNSVFGLLDTNGEIPFKNLSLSDYNYDYVLNEVHKISKIPLTSLSL
jgi:hypothetical protein